MDDATRTAYAETVDYLESLRPGSPRLLTALDPITEEIDAVTVKDAEQVRKFVLKHDGTRNLYFGVNPTRRDMFSKPAKTDLAAIEYLFGDLDPKETESTEEAKARYLAELKTYPLTPTAIIDSGNGIQCLWRLQEPIKLAEPVWTRVVAKGRITRTKIFPPETAAVIKEVEARTEALMKALGGRAGTQNIDRLLRLPGTTNLPNEKKIKEGRVACPTKLLHFNDAAYRLDDFPPAASGTGGDKGESQSNDNTTVIDWIEVAKHAGWLKGVADLRADFPLKGRMIIGHTGELENLNESLVKAGRLEKPYRSWSEVSLALAAIFKLYGWFTTEQIAAALMCPLPCNQHVLRQKKEDLKRRAVERLMRNSHEPVTATDDAGVASDAAVSELDDIGVTLDSFVAYMPLHCYIYIPTREPWPGSSVNSRIPPVPALKPDGITPQLDKKVEPKFIPAAAWLDKNRPVEQMTWAPGEPMLIRDHLVADGKRFP